MGQQNKLFWFGGLQSSVLGFLTTREAKRGAQESHFNKGNLRREVEGVTVMVKAADLEQGTA